MTICTKNRFQNFQKLYILYKSSHLARRREAQKYGGCPHMKDTPLIDIFIKFDFPVPEFGIHDASAPERVICCIAEDYFLFVSMGIADMELVHINFPFYWSFKRVAQFL